MTRQSVFPRRLFRWFLTQQILLSSISLIVLDSLILFWLERRDLPQDSLTVGRQIVWVTLASAAVITVGVSIWMARKLVIPLGRLIAKTRQIRKFPFEDETSRASELDYDEPGEWYDLERALNDLSRDLQKKTVRLSREKTELRAIMSAINEAVLAIDQDQRLLFYNPQFAVQFGLEGSSIIDMRVSEILRSPDILHAYESSLQRGSISRVDVVLDVPGGRKKSFQVSVAALRKKHNQEIYGAVAVFHDITELKKAEQMRIEFVGNVSHELRTPLTSVKGYLQTVQQDLERGRLEDAPSFLQIMDRNVERLIHLVDDLLDLSSLQAGVELKKKPLNLSALTQNVLNQVDSRGHIVSQRVEAYSLYADEDRVEQVLRNLIQNAVRYVPQGGKIEIVWSHNPGQGVHLHVRDNGPGIPKESQSRLFERFFRVDEARSRQVGGSGIGLSLVKQIMQRHGGDVKIISDLGQGAEFICEFPSTDKVL